MRLETTEIKKRQQLLAPKPETSRGTEWLSTDKPEVDEAARYLEFWGAERWENLNTIIFVF